MTTLIHFIAHEMGHVPKRGERHSFGGLDFLVLHTKGGAVRWFKVVPTGAAWVVDPVGDVPRSAGGHNLLNRYALVAAVLLAACAQAVSIAWPVSGDLTGVIGATRDVVVRGDTLWWLQFLAHAVLAALSLCEAPLCRAAPVG